MHHRVACGHGCEGTVYKVGVITVTEHGEKIDVCRTHRKPVTKVNKTQLKAHVGFTPPKKPPGMVRRVALPFIPALTR